MISAMMNHALGAGRVLDSSEEFISRARRCLGTVPGGCPLRWR